MTSDAVRNIKVLLFDLEGVLVPKNIEEDSHLVDKSIQIIKKYFGMLNSKGYICGIVTLRNEDRLIDELKRIPDCHIITSMFDKVAPVQKLLAEKGLDFGNLFYIGDDMFDVQLLNRAAVSAAPSNAHKEAKRAADFVITYAIVENLFNFILNEILAQEKV